MASNPSARARVLAFSAIVAIAAALPSCSLLLRPGTVEERPAGRTLLFPPQSGQHEAGGWTKTMEPRFVRLKGTDVVEVSVILSPYSTTPESYLPTPCGEIAISTSANGGVVAPARHEHHGAGRDVFTATFAVSDLRPFAKDEGGRLTLCNQSYVFGGRGLAALVN